MRVSSRAFVPMYRGKYRVSVMPIPDFEAGFLTISMRDCVGGSAMQSL